MVNQVLLFREVQSMKTQRNDPCPCLSGKKFKKCCIVEHNKAPMHCNSGNTSLIAEIDPEIEDQCHRVLAVLESGNVLSIKMIVHDLYRLYPENHMVNFVMGGLSHRRRS